MRWRDPRRASLHGPRRENGTVYLTKGRVDFFEGDSENTNDLDGTKRLAADNMKPGESLTYRPFVYNRDENEPRTGLASNSPSTTAEQGENLTPPKPLDARKECYLLQNR